MGWCVDRKGYAGVHARPSPCSSPRACIVHPDNAGVFAARLERPVQTPQPTARFVRGPRTRRRQRSGTRSGCTSPGHRCGARPLDVPQPARRGGKTTAVTTTTAMGRDSTIRTRVRWAVGDDAYTMPTMLSRTKRLAFTAVTATDTALLARAGGAPPAGVVVRIVRGCNAPLTPMPTLTETALGRWRATP